METFGNGRWIGLAGVVAVAVVLFWKGEPPREGLSPARSVPPSADLPGPRAKPADQTPTPVESDQLARQADDAPLISLADAKAAVRLKLHQWAERKPDDSETENRLMDELLALLTDGNAAELTRSLSADERGTPL